MPDPRDQVELSSTGSGDPAAGELYGPSCDAGSAGGRAAMRPWLALYFRCSNTYGRAYRNAAGTGYLGRCPKCGKSIRFRVGPGGTGQRMFEVSC
jgi:hypothetical protein